VLRSLLTSGLILGTACQAAAQKEVDPGNLNISATVGGKAYQSEGVGTCKHEPDAAIYNVPAALWMVEQDGSADASIKSLRLTVWRPKDGSPEQISLNLTTRSGSHRIDVGGRGDQVGSAKMSLAKSGAGGRFELKGRDQAGSSIDLLISCPAFAGIEAEGG
jgi:hypothetical protein